MKADESSRDGDVQGLERSGHGNLDTIVQQSAYVSGESGGLATQDENGAMRRMEGKQGLFRVSIETDT